MLIDSKIDIVIVDDHELFRYGLLSTIKKISPNIHILAECESCNNVYSFLERKVLPKIVFLDILLPDGSGIDLARFIKNNYPEIKIIMLSSEVSETSVNQLLDIGVEGYLSKLASKEDIKNAIIAVLDGNNYFGQNIAQIIYNIYIAKTKNKSNAIQNEISITDREIEVITLLCDGYSAKEIGNKLYLSSRTVESHKANIMSKLGFKNTAELIKYAIKHSIISLNK